jgi:hypothetical protein
VADQAGLLPVWTRWWGDSEVEALVPDPVRRREVEAELVRLPLAYFRRSLTAPAGRAVQRWRYDIRSTIIAMP